MANKQIIGTAEITTGVFTPTASMPQYQGENGATELNLTIYKNGIAYVKPEGASLRMYFYYEVLNEMTLSILMTVAENVATCDFNDVLTVLAKRPLCVVRELNAEKTTVICAFVIPVIATLADTVVAVSPVTADLLRPPYINTENGHWMEWDTGSETFVDSGVDAAGDGNYVSFLSQTLTTEQKAQARTNIGASVGTGTSSALLKGDGAGGFDEAVSGDDYVPPIGPATTEIQKGDGAGGLEDASPGIDFALPSGHYTALLDKDDWVGASAPYTQAVAVTGLVIGDVPIVDLVRSATQGTAEDEIASYLFCLYGKFEVTDDDELTVTCYADKPTVDLNLNLVGVK
jgi:hypothetical protein